VGSICVQSESDGSESKRGRSLKTEVYVRCSGDKGLAARIGPNLDSLDAVHSWCVRTEHHVWSMQHIVIVLQPLYFRTVIRCKVRRVGRVAPEYSICCKWILLKV